MRFNFGLIQQSETRNVFGGQALYTQSVRSWLAVLAGLDLRRDAPRNLELYQIDAQNQQQLTTSNLTLSFVAPFIAVDGLQARGEYEYVRAKPLGDDFTGPPEMDEHT